MPRGVRGAGPRTVSPRPWPVFKVVGPGPPAGPAVPPPTGSAEISTIVKQRVSPREEQRGCEGAESSSDRPFVAGWAELGGARGGRTPGGGDPVLGSSVLQRGVPARRTRRATGGSSDGRPAGRSGLPVRPLRPARGRTSAVRAGGRSLLFASRRPRR